MKILHCLNCSPAAPSTAELADAHKLAGHWPGSVQETISRGMSRNIHVRPAVDCLTAGVEKKHRLCPATSTCARPLTVREWRELLLAAGFRIEAELLRPMHLLEPRRLVRQHGSHLAAVGFLLSKPGPGLKPVV